MTVEEKEQEKFYQEVLDVCLTAARLMIAGGSEMYRVEDTMLRIARNAGVNDPHVFATPTGIFMSLDGGDLSQMTQVRDRNINLELVDRVNELSREFARQKISLDELAQKLKLVEQGTPTFPVWLQIVGAAVLSATLMVLFMNDYDWIDFPAAAIVGALGFWVYIYFKKYSKVRFLSELVAAIAMGLTAVLIKRLFWQTEVDSILIGALMTLVPGLAFTNSLRDLFTGDLISGIARLFEAMLTVIALGGGVVIVIRFLGV